MCLMDSSRASWAPWRGRSCSGRYRRSVDVSGCGCSSVKVAGFSCWRSLEVECRGERDGRHVEAYAGFPYGGRQDGGEGG